MKKYALTLAMFMLAAALLGCTRVENDDPKAENSPEVDAWVATPENDASQIAQKDAYAGIGHVVSYDDGLNITLGTENITQNGLTILCTSNDESEEEYSTGSPYSIDKLSDSGWVDVETIPSEEELCWTMEAWLILPNETVRWDVNWSYLYGELGAGSYRIKKMIDSQSDYKVSKAYYAYFDIVEPAQTEFVSYEDELGYGISVPYVQGWEYMIEEADGSNTTFGISFRPQGKEGWIHFECLDSFGVCGTGLEQEKYKSGYIGTYDGKDIWDFIWQPVGDKSFVATTENANDWYDTYGDTVMEIIDGTELKVLDATLIKTEEE